MVAYSLHAYNSNATEMFISKNYSEIQRTFEDRTGDLANKVEFNL